jgi:DNA adenine methylase
MTGPLKWHGGKRYLAEHILANAPPHTVYVEPYFGGGAVLFAKPAVGIEVINDLNRGLVNLWRVIQDDEAFPLFARCVNLTPVCEEFFKAARTLIRSQSREILDVSHAVAFFLVARQSFGGGMSSMSTPGARPRGGMAQNVSSWLSAIDGLADVHARLSRVFIFNRPALDVIDLYSDNSGAWLYLDPPYVTHTRVSGGVYAHEMTDADHATLLRAITSPQMKARVTLSGYRSSLYDEAMSSWRRIDTVIPNRTSSAKEQPLVTECLWCNY